MSSDDAKQTLLGKLREYKNLFASVTSGLVSSCLHPSVCYLFSGILVDICLVPSAYIAHRNDAVPQNSGLNSSLPGDRFARAA